MWKRDGHAIFTCPSSPLFTIGVARPASSTKLSSMQPFERTLTAIGEHSKTAFAGLIPFPYLSKSQLNFIFHYFIIGCFLSRRVRVAITVLIAPMTKSSPSGRPQSFISTCSPPVSPSLRRPHDDNCDPHPTDSLSSVWSV